LCYDRCPVSAAPERREGSVLEAHALRQVLDVVERQEEREPAIVHGACVVAVQKHDVKREARVVAVPWICGLSLPHLPC
jgi:hypothetical protein